MCHMLYFLLAASGIYIYIYMYMYMYRYMRPSRQEEAKAAGMSDERLAEYLASQEPE